MEFSDLDDSNPQKEMSDFGLHCRVNSKIDSEFLLTDNDADQEELSDESDLEINLINDIS